MIKNRATRTVAAIILVGGLAVAPRLDINISSDFRASDLPTVDPLPAQNPRFHILRRQGELALSGHTTSLKHEQDLLQVAASSYPDNTVTTGFQPLGIVPLYWEDTTLQVLYLLAETNSAEATLSTVEVSIRGVIVDRLAWKSRLDALRKSLPPDISISADILLIDTNISVSAICERAFAAFEVGPINFEESSAKFRNSAYPRLDRVVALANACKQSHITITGHTDSSGDEVWNRDLSRRRANAVGDYIVKGGVDRDRLEVSGLGSIAAIADNATRYGRSLNRRIELVLTGD